MSIFKDSRASKPRFIRAGKRRPLTFRPELEGLEHRVVLDGDPSIDPDGSLAAAVGDVVSSGVFSYNSSPPWGDVESWARNGMPWMGLQPQGDSHNTSGSYTIGSTTYDWTSSSTLTSSMTGSPWGNSSGGDPTWDWSITLSTNNNVSGTGDNGSYSTASGTSDSSSYTWYAWGDGTSISFEITRTDSSSGSNVLTLDSQPSLTSDNSWSSNYDFHANGSVVNGATTGTYALSGKTGNHYSFQDGTPKGGGGLGFTLGFSQDRQFSVDEQGTAQALTRSLSTSSGSDDYEWNESTGDSSGAATLGVTFNDNFILTNSFGNSASGTPDGTTLDTSGTDDYNLSGSEDGSGSTPSTPGSGFTASSTSELAPGAPPPGPPPAGPTVYLDERHAWHVGWDLFAGSPRSSITYYSYNSKWTQDLAMHQGIQNARNAAIAQLDAGTAVPGKAVPFSYSLAGMSNLSVLGNDIGHMGLWAAGGFYTNPDYYSSYFNVMFLGSYDGYWSVSSIDPAARTAVITFHVSNTSTLESATRIPVFGYWPGFPVKSLLSSKSGLTKVQVFDWSEFIKW